MDWEGILCIGIPDAVASTRIPEQRTLSSSDGTPVKLDGPAGLWGRAKFAVTDWDGDGRDDLIIAAEDGGVYRFLREELAQ